MIYNNLTTLIAQAMKNKDHVRLETLKLIKCEIVKVEKNGIVITEAEEAKILNKMAAQRKDSIEQFTKGNRMDLVAAEEAQLKIIEEFAPKAVSDDEIVLETQTVIDKFRQDGKTINMSCMKDILAEVKMKYPTANGKIVSQVVKNNI